MAHFKIGSVLRDSPVLTGVAQETLWCDACHSAQREQTNPPVYLVIWHSILAGVEQDLAKAEARLASISSPGSTKPSAKPPAGGATITISTTTCSAGTNTSLALPHPNPKPAANSPKSAEPFSVSSIYRRKSSPLRTRSPPFSRGTSMRMRKRKTEAIMESRHRSRHRASFPLSREHP